VNKEDFLWCLSKCLGEINLYLEFRESLTGDIAVLGCSGAEYTPLVLENQGKWESIADFSHKYKGFVIEYFTIPEETEEKQELKQLLDSLLREYVGYINEYEESK